MSNPTEFVEAALQPNEPMILAHLTRHFGDLVEGQIEIATIKPTGSDGNTGPRIGARQFGLGEMEAAAGYAADQNKDGSNVYFGVVPRKVGTTGRGKDTDCLPSWYVWVDLDDKGAAEAAGKLLSKVSLLPFYTVTTGRTPHTRGQVFFKLEEPIEDMYLVSDYNKLLAVILGGDRAVTNMGRIMRLGGSIAWPAKEGRVAEMTEFKPQASTPYSIEQIEKMIEANRPEIPAMHVSDVAFEHSEAGDGEITYIPPHDPDDRIVRTQQGVLGEPKVSEGREKYMTDTVMACLKEMIATGQCYGAPTDVAVKHLANMAWEQFSEKTELDRPGWNRYEQIYEKAKTTIRRYQAGELRRWGLDPNNEEATRRDWNLKNGPGAAVGNNTDPKTADVIPDRKYDQTAGEIHLERASDFVANFKPPEYLVDDIIQGGQLVSLTAQTGVGKTAVSICLALSIAQGIDVGSHGTRKGRVVYLCGENPDDVRMRLKLIFLAQDIDPDDIDLYLVDGTFNIQSAHERLNQVIKDIGGADVVFVDTLMAFFQGDDDNSNAQMAQYARDVLRPITRMPGKPAVVVPAHPTKNARGKDNLVPRGGGAFIAEVDGNLYLERQGESIVTLGFTKIRGPVFEPMEFALETIEHMRVMDSKGRRLKSVMAKAVSAAEAEERAAVGTSEENQLLSAMLDRPDGSERVWAEMLGWTTESGQPAKSKVSTRLNRLKDDEMVKKHRKRWVLTKDGQKEAEKARSSRKPPQQRRD